MSKTIMLNGIDFTNMFTSCGYVVGYESIQGKNGGVMLDGSTMEDELATKAVVKLPVMPLNEDDLSFLLSAIYEFTYVQLYYYDPKQKKYRDIVARKKVSEQKYRGFGSNGKEYWTGTFLTLTEK